MSDFHASAERAFRDNAVGGEIVALPREKNSSGGRSVLPGQVRDSLDELLALSSSGS